MSLFSRLLSFFRPVPPESIVPEVFAAAELPARPAYKHKRPAPRGMPGMPQQLRNDDITWTRIVQPRERYRVVYQDSHKIRSERILELQKIGEVKGVPYLGVMQGGKFKTFRADRIVEVLEQLTTGHTPSIKAWEQIRYDRILPAFPVPGAVYKVPTLANSQRTWTVDLNAYTCSCPEKRIRSGFGYVPGQFGFVCPHVARAILDHLPEDAGWSDEMVSFLRDPRNVHIDNLVTYTSV